jgi:aspartokinase
VLTCDPNIYANAIPVPCLTFDEAAELAYFGAQVILSYSLLSEKMLIIAPQVLIWKI